MWKLLVSECQKRLLGALFKGVELATAYIAGQYFPHHH